MRSPWFSVLSSSRNADTVTCVHHEFPLSEHNELYVIALDLSRIYYDSICGMKGTPKFDVDLGRAVANAQRLVHRAAECETTDCV